ncbi:MAG: hypothetical protein ACMUEM_02210 [Flavobacteriales bacterium AspAUS03]
MVVDIEKYLKPERQFFGFCRMTVDRGIKLNLLQGAYKDFGEADYNVFNESYDREDMMMRLF